MVISDITRLEELRSKGYKTIGEIANEILAGKNMKGHSTIAFRLSDARAKLGIPQKAIADNAYYSPQNAVKIKEEYMRIWG
jgi:hypothetical protein